MVSAKLSLFDWLLSSGEGTELSGFLKWNLISLNWNKLTPIIIIIIIIILLLLLIARKLTFEYDQMRVTSRIPKNYKQKQ